jgi:hypothetical protein
MKPKARKLTTGVLALTAVAIWIPQLLMGVVQKAPQPRPEVDDWSADAAPAEDSPAQADAAFEAAEEQPFDESAQPHEPSDISASDSLAQQLTATSEKLRAFGGPSRVDLDQLLQSFQQLTPPGAQAVAPPEAPPARSDVELAVPLFSGSAPPTVLVLSDPLAEFTARNTLNAIIWGQDGSLALLGDALVREGDELGDGIRVAEIQARRLRLERGESARWLTLPPFRTRAATGSDELSGGAAATTSGAGEAQDTPTPVPTPAPSAPSLQLDELQALMQAAQSAEENE